jgi:hypothetical protein
MPNFVNILDQMQFERTGEITSGPIIVLDVQNGSKEPGAALVLGPAHMQTRQLDSQLWEIQNSGQSDPFGNPFVFIINKNSGLALTSPNTPTGQSGIGLAVHQFPLKTVANQIGNPQAWQLLPQGAPAGTNLITSAHHGSVLGYQGDTATVGTPIILAFPGESNSKFWVEQFLLPEGGVGNQPRLMR